MNTTGRLKDKVLWMYIIYKVTEELQDSAGIVVSECCIGKLYYYHDYTDTDDDTLSSVRT